MHQNVVEMFDQLKEWQDTTGLKVMPSEADDKGLCDKAENYRQKQAKMRSKVMAENYPVDFEPLHALSLDCFASSGNGMVMWRSEFEREMLFSLPGWVEDDRKKQTFHNLQEILRSKDEAALKHLETLRSNALTLQQKLEKVAVDLRCAPTMSSVQETLAHRFLQVPDESAEPSLEKYVCRLCDFHCQLSAQMEEHIRDCHAADGSDRAVVEYRKKVIGLLQHAGPKVARFKCGSLLCTFGCGCRAFLVIAIYHPCFSLLAFRLRGTLLDHAEEPGDERGLGTSLPWSW